MLDDAPVPEFELVLPDRTRLPIVDQLTIGRAPASAVRLRDPTVSRTHARIVATSGGHGLQLEDAGSSYGTWLDGRRLAAPTMLHDGARVGIGDVELRVERRRAESEAGRTVVVPAELTRAVAAVADGLPRVRSGYALKRLEAAEGERRWVLENLRRGKFVRLADGEAELFSLIDGSRDVAELVADAEQRLGPSGPPRLAGLLTELAERGFLAGTPDVEPDVPVDGLRRLAAPRKWAWRGAGPAIESAYRSGGWTLFTRPALAVMAALAVVGMGAFAYLVAGRYGTPFVVASKVGIGGLVFLVGRLTLASLHELSHGLALASAGRRVREAGLKLVLVFPYLYVDTSAAWFEPRRRRMAVSAAGPAADLVLGGIFAIGCLGLGAGAPRDVLFQLTFGAYLAALLNLNPFVDRDGYQMLVDVLGEPGLRRRAREQLSRRISDGRGEDHSRVLAIYALAGIGWSLVAACAAVAVSLRYVPMLKQVLPGEGVWIVIAAVWLTALVPAIALVGPPLLRRWGLRKG